MVLYRFDAPVPVGLDAAIWPASLQTEMLLRAERAGGGIGRIYTVTYELTDGEGEMSILSANVVVPHDQGH